MVFDMKLCRLNLRMIPSFIFHTTHPYTKLIARLYSKPADTIALQQPMPQHTTVVPCSRNHPPYAAVRKPKIVIVGCSYAGMSATLTLTALKGGLPIPFASYGDYSHLQNVPSVQDFDITVVNERDGFFHSVGAPLTHISPAETSVMWKVYKGFSELSRPVIDFVQGTVISIDPTRQVMRYQDLEGRSQHLKYDYILISSGLRRPWPIVPRSRHFRSYLSDASTFIEKIIEAEKLGVVIVGGATLKWKVHEFQSWGAIGVEFAGKIKTHDTGTPVTLVRSRHQLLSNEPLPEEFKTRTLELLRAQGIDVILNQRADVQELPDGTFYVKFQDGNRLHTGMVIMAMASPTPSSQFLPSYNVSNESINTDSNLQMISRDDVIPRMFAAGDIVNVPGMKLGGNAMLMGSVAAANIYSLLVAQRNPSWRSAMERYVLMEPKMALSVGNSAVCYTSDDGVKYGKEWVEPMFG
ncbi:disulfide oxidoreductase [Aspergillus flavus]|nr:disulfide oxidoreductase [Aspergillus flavus]